MHLREVGGSSGEFDGLGVVNESRLEQHAVGNVLACVSQMLTDEGVIEAQLVREDDRFPVLAQRLGPVPVHRVNGHGEVTQPHQAFSISTAIPSASYPSLRSVAANLPSHRCSGP